MAEEYLTDDEQLEAVRHWFKEYAPWLIGGVLAGLAGFFAYSYYQTYTNGRDMKAAAEFSAMTAALQTNDRAKSRKIADELIKEYADSPYADQAQLMLARLEVDDGQLDKAAAPLTQIMNNSKDTELRQIARLRLARILTDQGKADEAIKMLPEPIPPAFAARYYEVRGDAYLTKKDTAKAVVEYQKALGAADASGINSSLLELKLQDLGAVPAPVLSSVSVNTLNKAKP
jgi:predicted negative regulator of RcsB-dependent stress response